MSTFSNHILQASLTNYNAEQQTVKQYQTGSHLSKQRPNNTALPWGGKLQEGQAGGQLSEQLVQKAQQTGRSLDPAG